MSDPFSTVAPTASAVRSWFWVRAVLALGAVLTLLPSTAGPATAGAGLNQPPPPASADTTTNGFTTHAALKLSGPGAPPGQHTVSVDIPMLCWWTPAPGAYTDPVAILADYDAGDLDRAVQAKYSGAPWSPMTTTVTYPDIATVIAIATPRSAFEQAANTAKTTKDSKLAWYVAVCRNSATVADYCQFAGECNGLAFHTYTIGATPAPKIDPGDLAIEARKFMTIPTPDFDYNPKLAKTPGATIVNLATWFWVKDPGAVAADTNGTRTITAEVGNISATVTATTTGLHITSTPAHVDTTCTPAKSTVSWQHAALESTACTVFFTKASVGYTDGYPVTAETTWNATWTGTGNPTGLPLPELTRETTINIPVAEIQTIVTLR